MSDAFKYAGKANKTGPCTVCKNAIRQGDDFFWNNLEGRAARACSPCAAKGGGQPQPGEAISSTPSQSHSHSQASELAKLMVHAIETIDKLESQVAWMSKELQIVSLRQQFPTESNETLRARVEGWTPPPSDAQMARMRAKAEAALKLEPLAKEEDLDAIFASEDEIPF